MKWVALTIMLMIVVSGVTSFLFLKQTPPIPPPPSEKPNVFVILVDDMGFNDVSFHGSNQFFTPNIDAMAYNGIILNNHYVPALCTPSRSALMTGKYPTSTGMHHFVIDSDEPWGLPLREKIMPQYFKDAGYSTSLFGKWHLGFHRRAFLPNNRGFDHFFGFRGPYIDYWDHELHKLDRNYSHGFDMWENDRPSYETLGNYSTILITDKAIDYVNNYDRAAQGPMFMYMAHEAPHTANEDNPMQAPQEVIDRFSYIEDPERRVLAAMLTVLDEQLGRFVDALDKKGMLENSVILFYSDNGAPTVGMHANGGSNYPFKGQKHSPWEGAIRSASFIWSPLLKSPNRVSDQLIHSSDWLPTLTSLAGIKTSDRSLDGLNVWEALSKQKLSPRREVVHNINPIYPYTSYLLGSWKYVNGTVNPDYDTWLGDVPVTVNPKLDQYTNEVVSTDAWKALSKYGTNNINQNQISILRKQSEIKCDVFLLNTTSTCKPKEAPCLFHITTDPCERINLANELPNVVSIVEKYLNEAKKLVVPINNKPLDPRADPALNYYQWTYWLDLIDERSGSWMDKVLIF